MRTFLCIWVSKKSLIAYLVLVALTPLVFPDELRSIPFAFYAEANPRHLVSLGIAALLLPQVTPANSLVEATYPSTPGKRFYATWIALLTGATLTLLWASGLATSALPFDLLLLSRNFLLGIGVLLISVRFLPAAMSWLPLLMYTGIAWLFGTQDDGANTPYAWALPLQPLDNVLAAVGCIAIFLAGLILFLTPRERTMFRI